jgi:hypothetical protein
MSKYVYELFRLISCTTNWLKCKPVCQSVLPCAAKAHQHNGRSFTACGRSGLMLIVTVQLTVTFMGMGSS